MEISPPAVLQGERERAADRLCILGLYIASVIPRLLAINKPPTVFYYNLDEQDVVFSSLDRLFGVPPVSIMEPATTVQVASLPCYMLDMLLRLGIPHNAGQFLEKIATYVSLGARDPRHLVSLTRVLVALVCSLAPLFAYQIARYFRASVAVALACALVVAGHPTFFFQSVMAAGDSVATTFVLLSIALLLHSSPSNKSGIAYAGIIFGFAVASKIIAAATIILPLMLIGWQPRQTLIHRLRLITVFAATAISGFIAIMPYSWTDPVRFAKAVFGTINKTDSRFQFNAFWELLTEAHGVILLAAAFGCAVVAIPVIAFQWSKHGRYAAAAIITLALVTLPIALHATTAAPRYFLITIPAIVVLFAAVGGAIGARPVLNRIAIGVLALIILSTTWKEFQTQLRLRRENDLVAALQVMSSIPHAMKIFIPSPAADLQIVDMPRSFWRRTAQRAAEMQEGEGVRSFLDEHRIPTGVADVLITAFNEDEQSKSRHAVAASLTAPDLPYDICIYAEKEEFARRQPSIDMSLARALTEFHSAGSPTAILIRYADPALGNPVWRGKSEWFWYISAGS